MTGSVQHYFRILANDWLPRILTQIDRDPTAKTYGCADRNWWHYKIRDFPSIILQQAGYTVYLASELPEWSHQKDGMRKLAAASCRFWSSRAVKKGAFEEYYPWEQGYPPLAFSTLAVMKLTSAGIVPATEVYPGVVIAARQLIARFEEQAANQQVAGLAALLWLAKVFPQLATRDQMESLSQKTLTLQNDEGWYEEYGGPDLGYLSVTIDCLWDCFDATGDKVYIRSAEAALHYIDHMTSVTGANIGMHNARNTDYIVPYGLVRFCVDAESSSREKAGNLVGRLYGPGTAEQHFLKPTDDRYLGHYIGHSLIRALALLERDKENACNIRESPPVPGDQQHVFNRSGHVLYPHAVISLRKGGIFTVRSNDRGDTASDFGWSVRIGNEQLVSHWWSHHWQFSFADGWWTVSGHLVPCREHISSPLKHLMLRAGSYTLGRSLIAQLKKTMIFRPITSPYHFERKIRVDGLHVAVIDRIFGLPADARPEVAPRASRRHVASADSYHREDFLPVSPGWNVSRSVRHQGNEWLASTEYMHRSWEDKTKGK